MSFFSRLERRIEQAESILCVGLDPHPEDLPEQSGQAAQAFCLGLIEATADLAAAFKPNSAFFEALGPEGMSALQEVIRAVPEDIPVILDAKRGDISSTARAYARAVFDVYQADAVTINPYLGFDALAPLIETPERGVFLLCKTSNPGASDLQDVVVQGAAGGGESRPLRLFEQVARLAQSWNKDDNLGLVVGATQVDSLAAVRACAPDVWILAPGIGAQGGDLGQAVQAGIRQDGLGLLVPVSRGISRAEQPRQAAKTFQADLQQEVERALNPVLNIQGRGRSRDPQAKLAELLLHAGCIKFGQFELKSGLQSPIYIDLRILASRPGLLEQVAAAYLPVLHSLDFARLAALPYAAMPIATAISLLGGWPMIYPRKEPKAYGTKADIEGEYAAGERAVIIDDLITTGGSKMEGIERLSSAGLEVRDVVVLIDRQSGGRETLAQKGIQLHAVLTLDDLLAHYREEQLVEEEKLNRVRQFLARPSHGHGKGW